MIKTVIKEVIFMILMIVAIALVLGIVLYDYNPTTKKIPTTVEAYSLPAEMQEELNETIQEAQKQNIIKTYSVDSSDLEYYEITNDYNPGKINPFDQIVSSSSSTNTENNSKNETTNGNSTNQGGTGIQGSFLNNVK